MTRGCLTSSGAPMRVKRIIDSIDFSLEPQTSEEVDSSEQKIEALADIICRASDEAAAALFVLMGTLESSRRPQVLANAAKYLAFTHCGESNLFGMVDARLAMIETLMVPS